MNKLQKKYFVVMDSNTTFARIKNPKLKDDFTKVRILLR